MFDHRGLGDAFPQFLSQAWTDPESGTEYPPLVLDDEPSIIHGARPLLRSVKPNAQINQQLASCLRVALEQHSLQMPVSSRLIYDGKIVDDEEDNDDLDQEPTPTRRKKSRQLTALEKYVFIEADA